MLNDRVDLFLLTTSLSLVALLLYLFKLYERVVLYVLLYEFK